MEAGTIGTSGAWIVERILRKTRIDIEQEGGAEGVPKPKNRMDRQAER
jgi:hypothetical protein